MTYELTETIPFNFDEIYSAVSTKLAEKGYDAIYEGSNTAQLVTAMSYLVSMLNANTAANINEMLLPLAQKRNNILISNPLCIPVPPFSELFVKQDDYTKLFSNQHQSS